MSAELLPALPLVISVATSDSLPTRHPLPSGNCDCLAVHSLPVTTHGDNYPHAGRLFMFGANGDNLVDAIVTIGPCASSQAAAGAANNQQYLCPGDSYRTRQIIIAQGSGADYLEHDCVDWPVVRPEELAGILKENEVFRRYGVNFPLGDTQGTLLLSALLLDRLTRSKFIGEQAGINYWFTDGPKNTRQPSWQAEVFALHPDVLYVQTAENPSDYQVFISQVEKQRDFDPAKILYEAVKDKSLLPTHRVMARRRFFDHVPFTTGIHTQNLVMLIAATEFAQAYNLPLGQVLDAAGVPNAHLEPKSQMEQDYAALIEIIGEVCYRDGIRFMDATPDHFRQMNALMRNNSKLGQLVPPIYTLIKDGFIDLDRVAEIEKRLFARNWSAIPEIVRRVMPPNMIAPNSTDDPSQLAQQLIETSQGDKPRGVLLPPDDYRKVTSLQQDGERKRALEHEARNVAEGPQQRFEHASAEQTGLFVFNASENISPGSPEMKILRERARGEFASRRYGFILPAHVERDTAGPITEHFASIMPRDLVVMVSKDDKTLEVAAGTGVSVIKEQNVLKLINWESMYELGILPTEDPDMLLSMQQAEIDHDGNLTAPQLSALRRTIDGTKGRTLLAGFLYLWAIGKRPPMIGMADTDPRNIQSYLPAETLTFPFVLPPANKRIIESRIARTGDERRNHTVFSAINRLRNSSDTTLALIGTILSANIWQLSGESIDDVDFWLNYPMTLNYGIETFRNLWAATRIARDNTHSLIGVQVATPEKKDEDGTVSPINDWIMTSWCAQLIHHYADFYLQYGKLPIDFVDSSKVSIVDFTKIDFDDPNQNPFYYLRLWNQLHAGRFDVITVPHDVIGIEAQRKGNKPNVTVRKRREVLLPPLGMWEKLELIDFAKLRTIRNYGRTLTPQETQGFPESGTIYGL
jgi:hypothetical protein